MQKSPINDKTLGVIVNSEAKFADIRQKALDDYVDRKKGLKHKKKEHGPPEIIPPGTNVVLHRETHRSDRIYYLVEIIDYNEKERDDVTYYGVIRKVSNGALIHRVGHLTSFTNSNWSWLSDGGSKTGLKEEDIKWIQNI
jgi:hypothetical protein